MKAGHAKTRSSQREEVEALWQRIRQFHPAKVSFDYGVRSRAVADAHQLYNASFRLKKKYPQDAEAAASLMAWRVFGEAINAAYPESLTDDFQRLRAGDASGMEGAVQFLEADPMFFRTGYVKEKLNRAIKPAMLTPEYVTRLQRVVLHVVDTRDDRDFRGFCRLARKVDGPELRAALESRQTAATNPDVRRRARWVLEALNQPSTWSSSGAAGNPTVLHP